MNALLRPLGRRIQQLRAAKGWSQDDFGHAAGLHPNYCGQVERGEKNVSFENLVKISTALGTTVSQLLSGLEEGLEPEKVVAPANRAIEIQRISRRLVSQQVALSRTVNELNELVQSGNDAETNKKQPPKLKKTPSRTS